MSREALSVLGETFRSYVAVTLVLSAVWKIRNHQSSFLALRRMVGMAVPVPAVRILRAAVLATEFCVVIALSIPSSSRIGAVAGAVIITLFSVALIAADDVGLGCGCWRDAGPSTPKTFYLVRNGFIGIAAVGGIVLPNPGHIAAGQLAFTTCVGLLLGLISLEMPGLASLVRSTASAH